jgi:PAS domain S-box-containing protein
VRKIWNVEQKLGDAVRMAHEYVRTGDGHFRRSYETLHAAAEALLNEMNAMPLQKRELQVMGSLMNDLNTLDTTAARIFEMRLENPAQQARARALAADLDNLLVWMQNDIERYKQENAVRLETVAREIEGIKVRISILFGFILFTVIGFLFAFGWYLYRKVSLPLAQLWSGAEAISRGDLDHRVLVRGETDIMVLAERFNEMAQKLKASYADLERRLLERTHQLAALNSVALTLGKSGLMRDMLQRSLATVLESFSGLEPRGGIFLCESDAETLRLVAHQGLTPEFAAREERIRMGECLCGAVAKTGELVFTEQGCEDARHTRQRSGPAHGHIVFPIKSRGAVLGVVFLYPEKEFALKPSDIQMFDTIGAQLGMAVENLRLYAEVKESSLKFWDLFENSRDILFTVDLEGRLAAVNKASEQFLGRSKQELLGANVLEFVTEDGKALGRRILSGELPVADRVFEFEVRRPGGGRAFVEVTGRSLFVKDRPVGFQVSARDVTEQKNLRELLVQAERLAAIGQLGIAMRHEINNPLTTVIGNAELLIDRHGGRGDDLPRRLQLILDNALRIAEILKRLQDIRQDRTVEYVEGLRMTDLGPSGKGP